jgi:hypothetical protein
LTFQRFDFLWQGWPVLCCVLAGAILRGVYLTEQAQSPTFGIEYPGLDAALYHDLAVRIASGDLLVADTTFQASLLFAYWEAALFALFGAGPWPARVGNLLLGVANIALIAAIAGQLHRERWVAGIAAFIAAIYAPLVIMDTSALKTTSAITCAALGLLLLLRALRDGKRRYWIGAGAALAVAAHLWPQFSPALVLTLLFLPFLRSGEMPPEGPRALMTWFGSEFRSVALVGFGAALALSPLLTRDLVIHGSPHLHVQAQSGIHAYIGNQPSAWGGYTPVRYIRANPAGHVHDMRVLAERIVGERLTPTQASRFWIAQAINAARAVPGRWIRLAFIKLGLTLNAAEVPNNIDPDQIRHASGLLRWGCRPPLGCCRSA